jgi:hypothetical protein
VIPPGGGAFRYGMRPLSRFSSNRTIIQIGILICVVGAIIIAILLGVLDRLGLTS